MKKIFILRFFLIAFSLISSGAQAVIIEGNFKGFVNGFHNGEPDAGWVAYWDDVDHIGYGTAASGTFWYDTDKAPSSPTINTPTATEYSSNSDSWVSTTFNVGGKIFNVSDLKVPVDNDVSWEGVAVDSAIWGENTQMFHVFDAVFEGYPWNLSAHSFIEIMSANTPMLDGLGLVQEFDWVVNNALGFYGQARFGTLLIGDLEAKYLEVWIDIEEFHVRVRNSAAVPEPSSLLLLLVGFLSLYLIRKRFISEK